jgi:hypothetical protein
MSLLLLLFILMKFIPKKTTAIFTIITGSSLYLFVTRWVLFNFNNLTESIQIYTYCYIALCALISLIYFYYRGPVTNPRALNLIEWGLKLLSILFIYFGMSYREISLSIILAFLLVKLFGNFKLPRNSYIEKLR